MVNSVNFGENLRKVMEQRKISGKELAEKLGVSTPCISRWLNNDNYPKPAMAAKIASILSVDYSVLVGAKELGNIFQLPLLSWVQAGIWTASYTDYAEYIDIPYSNIPQGCFVLRVRGESMSRASGKSYFDGCYVIVNPNCDKNPEELHHKVVIARNNGEATIKEFVLEDNQAFLKPYNTAFNAFPVTQDVEIVGEVIKMFD